MAKLFLILVLAVAWTQNINAGSGQSGRSSTNTYKLVDIDGDKEDEIVYGSAAGFVHVIKKDMGIYREKWASMSLQSAIVVIIIDDVDQDHQLEIIAGTEKGDIYVFGTEQFNKKWDNFHHKLSSITGLFVDDIDGDGKKEMVVYNSSQIHVFEGGSYFKEWTSDQGTGGERVVVGNVDRTKGKELVTNTGYIIDPVFYRVKWKYDPDFGDDIWLTDLDSDGMEEVLGIKNKEQITVYDLDLKSARIR